MIINFKNHEINIELRKKIYICKEICVTHTSMYSK
jgi:hypothetical protein